MKRIILSLLSLMLLPVGNAAANIGVGARVSTMGISYEAFFPLTDYLVLRGGISQYDGDYDTEEDGIDYQFDAEYDSKHLYLDIHPFTGKFRITAGIIDNDTRYVGRATLANSYDIGGQTYTPAEVGTLHSVFGWADKGTYVGIGWGAAPRSGSGFGFSVDIGVLMQDAPDAILFAEGGTLAADPAFQDDIAAEEQTLREELSDFDTYPVISLGISYSF